MAEALAAAFVDDPVATWMIPDLVRRRELLPGLFELEVIESVSYNCVHTVGSEETVDGAAVWFPPEAADKSPADGEAFLEAYLAAAGEFADTVGHVLELVDKHRPAEPHFSLEIIGTHPDRRGGGRGSALLAPVLKRCDRDGVPAYLESSNVRSVPFYQRHGFEVTGEVSLPDGTPVHHMRRAPRR